MPIQTTKDDVVFSGHGISRLANKRVTRVPEGVEFHLIAPPGASISDPLGHALEIGEYIKTLYLQSHITEEYSPHEYSTYTSKSGDVPNLVLFPPRDLDIFGNIVPHLIGVEEPTNLHDLWARIHKFIVRNQTIRVFWAACSALNSNDCPYVTNTTD